MGEIPRLLSDDIKRKEYDKNVEKYLSVTDNLHWGQRKLLMSEIEFLTNYFSAFDDTKKYVLYIGSSEGFHINYLMDMFPDLYFILYDKRKTHVNKEKAIIYEQYFTDDDAKKYANMNLFMICDIRNLDVSEYKNNLNKLDKLIIEDMKMQQKWFSIINPKKALLKFRLPYTITKINYLDGDIYFQIWAKNASTETRLVPNNKEKEYDAKKYEEQLFYFNNTIRRKKYTNDKFNCLGDNYDCIVEAKIIENYLKKFKNKSDIYKMICDVSLSVTIYLSKYMKNPISDKYLKK
jgi:cap2 methyltransferase